MVLAWLLTRLATSLVEICSQPNPWHRKGRDSFSAKLPANLKVRELRDRLLSLADMAKYYHDDLLPTRIRMENRRGKA